MASRWRTGATHIKVVRRPPEERPWPRSPSHNGAGLRGLGGGRGEPQSARRPPRARTVAVGRDVRRAGIVAVAGATTEHDSGELHVPGQPRSRQLRYGWMSTGSRRVYGESRLWNCVHERSIDQTFVRTDIATLAYLHRKSLSKPGVRAFEVHLESLGLRVIR